MKTEAANEIKYISFQQTVQMSSIDRISILKIRKVNFRCSTVSTIACFSSLPTMRKMINNCERENEGERDSVEIKKTSNILLLLLTVSLKSHYFLFPFSFCFSAMYRIYFFRYVSMTIIDRSAETLPFI